MSIFNYYFVIICNLRMLGLEFGMEIWVVLLNSK
jgi:hypothetical protein